MCRRTGPNHDQSSQFGRDPWHPMDDTTTNQHTTKPILWSHSFSSNSNRPNNSNENHNLRHTSTHTTVRGIHTFLPLHYRFQACDCNCYPASANTVKSHCKASNHGHFELAVEGLEEMKWCVAVAYDSGGANALVTINFTTTIKRTAKVTPLGDGQSMSNEGRCAASDCYGAGSRRCRAPGDRSARLQRHQHTLPDPATSSSLDFHTNRTAEL